MVWSYSMKIHIIKVWGVGPWRILWVDNFWVTNRWSWNLGEEGTFAAGKEILTRNFGWATLRVNVGVKKFVGWESNGRNFLGKLWSRGNVGVMLEKCEMMMVRCIVLVVLTVLLNLGWGQIYERLVTDNPQTWQTTANHDRKDRFYRTISVFWPLDYIIISGNTGLCLI